MPTISRLLAASTLLWLSACASIEFSDLARLKRSPPTAHLSYGSAADQFGVLRLPRGKGPFPVAILLHGGCWRAGITYRYLEPLASALTQSGVATWNLEYRRIGGGGGWPTTFQDVARGSDFLREAARRFPLDLSRVVSVGHSAGGQLALWLAARRQLPLDSELWDVDPLPLAGVAALAPVADLRADPDACGGAIPALLGGLADEVPQRYRQTSPAELPPPVAPVKLIHGEDDALLDFAMSRRYADDLRRRGAAIELLPLVETGHFDLVAPHSAVWPRIERALLNLLRGPEKPNPGS